MDPRRKQKKIVKRIGTIIETKDNNPEEKDVVI
jgi:hypothetical protein